MAIQASYMKMLKKISVRPSQVYVGQISTICRNERLNKQQRWQNMENSKHMHTLSRVVVTQHPWCTG